MGDQTMTEILAAHRVYEVEKLRIEGLPHMIPLITYDNHCGTCGTITGTASAHQSDMLTTAGYRQIFDGDCGLSGIEDAETKKAAEAWMRWSNLVMCADVNSISAMKQMLAEFGYSKSGKEENNEA